MYTSQEEPCPFCITLHFPFPSAVSWMRRSLYGRWRQYGFPVSCAIGVSKHDLSPYYTKINLTFFVQAWCWQRKQFPLHSLPWQHVSLRPLCMFPCSVWPSARGCQHVSPAVFWCTCLSSGGRVKGEILLMVRFTVTVVAIWCELLPVLESPLVHFSIVPVNCAMVDGCIPCCTSFGVCWLEDACWQRPGVNLVWVWTQCSVRSLLAVC